MVVIHEPIEKAMAVPPASHASDWVTPDNEVSYIGLGHNCVLVLLDFSLLTLDTGGDELDIYLQTYIFGRWVDFAQIHFANANDGETPEIITNHKWSGTPETNVLPLTRTTADDTVDASIPLGSAIRLDFDETTDATFTVVATMRSWYE